MTHSSPWAVILAGGDGRRLQSLTRFLAGDDRPKQFCRLLGERTLLGETMSRVATVVAPDATLYVVTRKHESFYRRELAGVQSSHVVEQPFNRGTTVAMAYALARVRALSECPVVGFFPADHHYANAGALRRSLVSAYAAAERMPDRVLLVGAEATGPESEYGWIEPGRPVASDRAARLREPVRNVSAFWEKPSRDVAAGLLAQGCLWNTFTMVGRVDAFERLIEAAEPGLLGHFAPVRQPHGRSSVPLDPIDEVYAGLPVSDFSSDVLMKHPESLAVLPIRKSGWTDLGHPDRVIGVLSSRGLPAPRLRAAAAS